MELHGTDLELPIKYSAHILSAIDEYFNKLWSNGISRSDSSVKDELCFFYYKDKATFDTWHKKGWTKDHGPGMVMIMFDLAEKNTTIVGEDPVIMKELEKQLVDLNKN